MQFGLIDRIVELERGRRIVAVKAVSRSEEYLADHFPTFPVLPGVLMLEAMVEAAGWLVRDAQDFARTVILLKEAKNVTYKSFVGPGHALTLTVTCRRLARDESEFLGVGHCGADEVVRGRFTLKHLPAEAAGPPREAERRNHQRARFASLCGAPIGNETSEPTETSANAASPTQSQAEV
ncbi:MAG: beta-hydroxyacyl-ACP dehydratase [Planctomycetota bacterium]|nr:MAG: beta-hydroxyacyl-ACP dehydratase [Planctomycetota bacterium]